jgi:alkanesulfonate monooxygenase SsuD/methylene tetrahydromethanopterin reductase-like flavin-dependent oxidoreductase (luciferase family)
MRLSLIVSPTAGHTYDELREIALAVEAAGIGSLWIRDKHKKNDSAAETPVTAEKGAVS